MDFVALVALLILPLTGVIKFEEALKGFSDQSIILIALMFIVGESLERTGVSSKVGQLILKFSGDSPKKLMIFLMLAVGIIGSVMSSTGIVALFIPVALSICRKIKISPSKMMMPLAIAGGVSGMMTLVATPPNMIASAALERAGLPALKFFDFTLIGLSILLVSIIYMFFASRFLKGDEDKNNDVPANEINFSDFVKRYELNLKTVVMIAVPDSKVCGKKIGELNMRAKFGGNIVCIERRRGIKRELLWPQADTELRSNDVLLVDFVKLGDKNDDDANATRMCEFYKMGIEKIESTTHFKDVDKEHGLVEVLIPQSSRLVDHTIAEQNFRVRYGMNVIGIIHNGKAYTQDLHLLKLGVGDSLLLNGPWSTVGSLNVFKRDMVLLTLPEESKNAIAAPGRAPLALIALVVMVGLMIAGVVPNAMAALIGAVLLLVFRCIEMDNVYRCINWSTLILIIGMYPFATAIEQSGGIELAVNTVTSILGAASPHIWLLSIMLLVMVVGLFISNTVVAILLAPVAVEIALNIGVSPVPFVIAVAIACSASFITPVSTPINTLVMGPGRYQFFDYVKFGLPAAVLVLAVSVVLIPLIFPF